jgi:[protein-PII] uridylyltransferase
VTHGFLTEFEYKQLFESETFLWKIRFALHHIAKRNENRLLFDHQRGLAALLGYSDNNASRAVEQFMKDYYRVAMTVSMLNEMLLQYFDEAILRVEEQAIIIPINDDFQLRDNYIEVTPSSSICTKPIGTIRNFFDFGGKP